MRYLFVLLVLVGCNDDRKEMTLIALPDSLYLNADTLNTKLMYLDSVSKQTVFNLTHKIEKLKEEKEVISKEQITYQAISSDSHDERISELNRQIRLKDQEIASLKNQLNDIYKPIERPRENTKSVPFKIQPEIITPDENSLVVNIDKGDLNATGVELYLIPFKGNKKYLGYDAYCDNSVNSFRKAESYDNLFFFNGVPRGKYIVKICYYYGGYKVVNKGTGKETISMQLSPPIQ